jgi:hypothetical protein
LKTLCFIDCRKVWIKIITEYPVVAVARTKKQAKQQAALKMLNRLKTSLADVLTLTGSEKGDASLGNVCTTVLATHIDHMSYATISLFFFLSASLILFLVFLLTILLCHFFSVLYGNNTGCL